MRNYDDIPKSEWQYIKGQKNDHDGKCEIVERRRSDTELNKNRTRK